MRESVDLSRSNQTSRADEGGLWRWHPSEGRWSAERHGLPRTAVFLSLSTEPERPSNRYDFWRNIALYDFDGHPRRYETPEGFDASANGLIGMEGSLFSYRSDALSGERPAASRRGDGGDDVTIGLLLEGERQHAEGDYRHIAGPGQFFAYDAGRASTVRCSRSQGVLVVMRRHLVEAALGGEVPSSAVLADILARSSLAPFLSSQMCLLARLAEELDEQDRAPILRNTLDLVALALGSGNRSSMEEKAISTTEEEHGPRRLLAAALKVIQRNLSDALLGPEMLASILGCSRAKLYRAFAEYGLTISAVIREMRLKQARSLIESLPPDIPIAEIAMRCGFLDAANFSRNFRLYFGASPTALRYGG